MYLGGLGGARYGPRRSLLACLLAVAGVVSPPFSRTRPRRPRRPRRRGWWALLLQHSISTLYLCALYSLSPRSFPNASCIPPYASVYPAEPAKDPFTRRRPAARTVHSPQSLIAVQFTAAPPPAPRRRAAFPSKSFAPTPDEAAVACTVVTPRNSCAPSRSTLPCPLRAAASRQGRVLPLVTRPIRSAGRRRAVSRRSSLAASMLDAIRCHALDASRPPTYPPRAANPHRPPISPDIADGHPSRQSHVRIICSSCSRISPRPPGKVPCACLRNARVPALARSPSACESCKSCQWPANARRPGRPPQLMLWSRPNERCNGDSCSQACLTAYNRWSAPFWVFGADSSTDKVSSVLPAHHACMSTGVRGVQRH